MRRQQRQQLLRLNLHLQRSNRQQQRRFYYYNNNSCSSSISSSSNINSSSSSGRNNVTTTSPSQSPSQSQPLSSQSLSFSLWTNNTIPAAHNVVNTKNSNNKSIMSSNNNTRIRSNYRYYSSNSDKKNGTTSEITTVRSRKEEEEEKEDDEGDNDDEKEERETSETFLTVIERHSIEDTIISVHVSDKIFKTLKSTLQYSPILWETIVRSEEQQQQNKSDTIDSIFIDRDPKHFPTILAYLRNEADGISYSSNDVSSSNGGSSTKCTASAIYKIKGKILASKDKSNNAYTKYVRLPSGGDAAELEELFIEAKHYQLDDLQKQLRHCTFALQAISFLRGSGSGNNNPFNGLKEIIQTIRTTTLMLVGTGTTIGGINWATSFSETKNTILLSLFGGG
ncbi:hypothetical protein FRACYDRAFT_254813 [Fragilariopsis cylindrus CCMP1102]|uniref:BTB domain-containing protein n=1 Tax=Fragilariopsis cylindrus CCMP1102 TaxID=635003 RepID=A0A1E7EKG0_9STRA|nr:hypothetical protein FRACYDRAFT_254813 [Fragilariopsis cylindrus CCMP1102]|eukprot:OEU06368.1 hypothetical protein FRACYDRAFT_254813 [Fragilariopsis cylindrus CCMP1102]